MRYSKEDQRYHLERVRQVMVMFPSASLKEMRAILAKATPPLIFNVGYISRLKDAVLRERIWRLKNNTVALRITEVEDRVREIQKALWKISQESTFDMARVLALEKIGKLEFDMFQSQLDAGVFERNIGTVNVRAALDPEERAKAVQTLQQWGLVKDGVLPQLETGPSDIKSNDEYDFLENVGEDSPDAPESSGGGGRDTVDRAGAGEAAGNDNGGPVLAPVQPLSDDSSGSVPLQPA